MVLVFLGGLSSALTGMAKAFYTFLLKKNKNKKEWKKVYIIRFLYKFYSRMYSYKDTCDWDTLDEKKDRYLEKNFNAFSCFFFFWLFCISNE